MDNFYKYWFGGFEEALNKLDDNNRKLILKECGNACSDSYTRQVFLDAKRKSGSVEEFLEELRKTFTELMVETVEKEHQYIFTYRFCACDLVKEKLVSSPHLCECSRSSLLYNLEAVYGEGKVQVEKVQTILSGASCCRFKITIL
jgi:hypothetical protein